MIIMNSKGDYRITFYLKYKKKSLIYKIKAKFNLESQIKYIKNKRGNLVVLKFTFR